jgi:hypothetical protein
VKKFKEILEEAINYHPGYQTIKHDASVVPEVFKGTISKGALQSGDPSLVTILGQHAGMHPSVFDFQGDDMVCSCPNCGCGGQKIVPGALRGCYDVNDLVAAMRGHADTWKPRTEGLDEKKVSRPKTPKEYQYGPRKGQKIDWKGRGDDQCVGCGSQPGDGRTPGCKHPDGCGYQW